MMPTITRKSRWALQCTVLLCLAALTAASGCGTGGGEARREYELRGKVIEVDKDVRKVTVAHEEVPGFMGAMTMPFSIKDDWAFTALAPGHHVAATLVVEGDRYWLEDITIGEGPRESPVGVTIDKGLPAALGAEVPDFELTNQDGREIRLGGLRGKAVLITFIYTRCPLPDYCPLMTSQFMSLYRSLRKDQALLSRTHMISVSFDPDFDKPQVLKEYAEAYLRSEAPASFRHWDFATGTHGEIRKMAGFFGLDYWPEGGQIVHSLRTAIISTDGKLVRLYRGNDWTPGDLLRDLRNLQKGDLTQE